MNNEIIHDGREAAYLQVARRLRGRLEHGTLGNDGTLPSFRALAGEFGVSVGVIQRAMEQLRSESLVRIHHGKVGRAVPGQRFAPELAKYALIHPYTESALFGRLLPALTMKALESNNQEAMLTVRSSGDDPQLERQLAETLVYNGVEGLLLSPENRFANTAYFEELARKIPVMLLDQAIPGSLLPAVTVDYAGAGDEIGRTLRRKGRREMLAILNESCNSSIRELLAGIEKHLKLKRFELPLFRAEHRIFKRDFTLWDGMSALLIRELEHSEADVVFSPFHKHFDELYLNAVPDSLRAGRLNAVLRTGDSELLSRRYCTEKVLEWSFGTEELLTIAVSRLVKWRQSGRIPHGVKKIKMEFQDL